MNQTIVCMSTTYDCQAITEQVPRLTTHSSLLNERTKLVQWDQWQPTGSEVKDSWRLMYRLHYSQPGNANTFGRGSERTERLPRCAQCGWSLVGEVGVKIAAPLAVCD